MSAAPTETRHVAYVPELAAALLNLSEVEQKIVVDAITQLGKMLEVDLTAVALVDPGLGRRLNVYWAAASELWGRLSAGGSVSGVAVRLPLTNARQTDSSASRSDLRGELTAAEHMSTLRPALTILDTEPDWDALSEIGTLERDGSHAALTVIVYGGLWPLCLGGPRRPGELYREVRIEANHAAWRDRRVRRLRSLSVNAVEIWPDPDGF